MTVKSQWNINKLLINKAGALLFVNADRINKLISVQIDTKLNGSSVLQSHWGEKKDIRPLGVGWNWTHALEVWDQSHLNFSLRVLRIIFLQKWDKIILTDKICFRNMHDWDQNPLSRGVLATTSSTDCKEKYRQRHTHTHAHTQPRWLRIVRIFQLANYTCVYVVSTWQYLLAETGYSLITRLEWAADKIQTDRLQTQRN